MSKTNKKAPIAFKDASAKLVKQVEGVIAEAKKHTFSVSRVFAAYNEVFNLNETPQTCASCLRSRAEKLTAWYNEGNKSGVKQLVPEAPVADGAAITVNEAGELSGEPTFPITFIIVDGEDHFAVEDDGKTVAQITFTPAGETALYGLATDAQGQAVPDGNYKQNENIYLVSEGAGGYVQVIDTAEDFEAGKALLAFYEGHRAKLAELGIDENSSDADLLGALELLDADENATDEERAHYAERIPALQEKIAADTLAANAQGLAEGTTVLTLKDETAQAVHFVTEDKSAAVVGSKGTVKHADGSNVKTGTHELADGSKLAVAVGGRATIK